MSRNTTVWKFHVGSGDRFIEMQFGAEILCAGVQSEDVYVWAKVDPEARMGYVRVGVFCTGDTVLDGMSNYVGTVMTDITRDVLHVFSESRIVG